jgi:HEAT repeat protein
MPNPSYSEQNRELLAVGLKLLEEDSLSDSEIASLVNDFAREHFEQALPAIEKLFDHHDPIVRMNALDAIGFTFGETSRLSRIVEILKADVDEDVRSSAATSLAGLSGEAVKKATLAILAQTVRNEAETDFVRLSAYQGILSIKDVAHADRPDVFNEKLSDIDWGLVP